MTMVPSSWVLRTRRSCAMALALRAGGGGWVCMGELDMVSEGVGSLETRVRRLLILRVTSFFFGRRGLDLSVVIFFFARFETMNVLGCFLFVDCLFSFAEYLVRGGTSFELGNMAAHNI